MRAACSLSCVLFVLVCVCCASWCEYEVMGWWYAVVGCFDRRTNPSMVISVLSGPLLFTFPVLPCFFFVHFYAGWYESKAAERI